MKKKKKKMHSIVAFLLICHLLREKQHRQRKPLSGPSTFLRGTASFVRSADEQFGRRQGEGGHGGRVRSLYGTAGS